MPLPAAIAVPPAAGAFCAAAAAATKHLALRAAPFLDISTLTWSAVTAWIFRYLWKNKIPEWAKEDISCQALLGGRRNSSKSVKNKEDDDGDDDETEKELQSLSASEREKLEMANLSSVLEKLKALIDSVQLDDDHPTIIQQYAALMALIQLSGQIKRQEQQELLEKKHHICNKQEDNIMEEKKENEHDTKSNPTWNGRDSLYENSVASESLHIDNEFYEFIRNPQQSPLQNTLQNALEFATWAYYDDSEILANKLSSRDFELLVHSSQSAIKSPGHASYYLAVSSVSKKQVVVGIRGTSTLEDIITDCCGRAVPLDDRPYYYDHDRGSKLNRLSNIQDPSRIEVSAAKEIQIVHTTGNETITINHSEEQASSIYPTGETNADEATEVAEVLEIISGHERIWVEQCTGKSHSDEEDGHRHEEHMLRCHEGIMVSAKRLVDRIQAEIEDWVIQKGYQLVLCGHSLGAGCASIAAVLLRSRLPELTHHHETGNGVRLSKMRVFCFAPPPVLDKDAALAASSYCTSIVNNVDMIPRCSLENLLILLEILKGIWHELQKQNLAPTGPATTTSFFRKIAKGFTDENMLMTPSALRILMHESLMKIQNETESNGDRSEEESDKVSPSEAPGKKSANPIPLYIPGVVLLAYQPWRDQDKVDVDNDLNKEIDTDTDKDEQFRPTKHLSWQVTDGMTPALHFLELETRMGIDHATTSYYSLLNLKYEW